MTQSPSNRVKVKFDLDTFAKAEHWTWQAFVAYQEAADDLEIIESHAKDMLAKIMTDIRKASKELKISEAALERMARASEEWEVYQTGHEEALKKAGKLKVKYKSAERYWDTIQSGLAFKRAEIKKIL